MRDQKTQDLFQQDFSAYKLVQDGFQKISTPAGGISLWKLQECDENPQKSITPISQN